jgi:hypothetical protein
MSTPAFMLSPNANMVDAGNWSSPPVWASTMGRPRCRSSSTVLARAGVVVVGAVDVVEVAVVVLVPVMAAGADDSVLAHAVRSSTKADVATPARPLLLTMRRCSHGRRSSTARRQASRKRPLGGAVQRRPAPDADSLLARDPVEMPRRRSTAWSGVGSCERIASDLRWPTARAVGPCHPLELLRFGHAARLSREHDIDA